MAEITLGDIGTWAAFFLTLAGSCVGIYEFVKKALKKMFAEQTKGIEMHLEKQEKTIKQIDLENCKNFLVSFLAKVDKHENLDEIEVERFWEQYEHYSNIGGNSYIKNKVEKLKSSGKI